MAEQQGVPPKTVDDVVAGLDLARLVFLAARAGMAEQAFQIHRFQLAASGTGTLTERRGSGRWLDRYALVTLSYSFEVTVQSLVNLTWTVDNTPAFPTALLRDFEVGSEAAFAAYTGQTIEVANTSTVQATEVIVRANRWYVDRGLILALDEIARHEAERVLAAGISLAQRGARRLG